jgi:16S rRNA (uracil1498-N3)-methyltransferase
MDLKRFFVTNKILGENVILENEEFYHAVKVTRHKVGYIIIVCDNTNFDYYAKITEINKDNLIAKVEKKELNLAESTKNISLYLGINKDIDTSVQKAIELGVTRIVPFTSQHGNINEINYERLNKIILESSKQCGRSQLATLETVVTFKQAIQDAKDTNLLLFYEHESNNKIFDAKLNFDIDTSIFIGSEGGFSIEEIDFAKDNNAKVLTLGKRILRVSTAIVSAITLCMAKLGEM